MTSLEQSPYHFLIDLHRIQELVFRDSFLAGMGYMNRAGAEEEWVSPRAGKGRDVCGLSGYQGVAAVEG
ncbi:MAG: hypothetical protein ACK5TN_03590, partial [Acidobacteriota bacterium]